MTGRLRAVVAGVRQTISWLVMLACLASLAGAVWWVAVGKADPAADIAGFRPYVIATGSMAPEYQVSSFVITRETPFDDVEVSDVVAFRSAALDDQAALHRVIDVQREDGRTTALVVKGDNNPHPDGAPVTRETYLGTAVAHTNVTSFVVEQFHGPYGVVRVVVVPAAVLILTWLAVEYLRAGRRTAAGRTLATVVVLACLGLSATASYALYLGQKQEHVTSTLSSAAVRYDDGAPADSMTIDGTEVTGSISIPRIDVHYPVIDYVAASSLDVAITHFAGPGLNQEGNVVLAGHRSWGNLFFTRIDQLAEGDTIWITDSNRQRVRYVVTGHREVAEDDTAVLDQPGDGKRHLTLISCTYAFDQRHIVDAVAAEDLARPPAPPSTAAVEDAGLLPDLALPVALGLSGALAAGLALSAAGAVRRRRR